MHLKKGTCLPIKATESMWIYRTVYMEVDANAKHNQKEIEDMTLLTFISKHLNITDSNH